MANSPVINHYFSRRGVAVKKGLDNELQKEIHKDVYVEFDKVKNENRVLKSRMDELERMMKRLVSREVDERG